MRRTIFRRKPPASGRAVAATQPSFLYGKTEA